jgi:ubiquinone/menaquinone biosynthesis C-methylase UbiE
VNDFCEDKLPFDDESFDMVFCKDVLEHLLFPDKTVHEMQRVLKKGGYALIHVPNHFTIKGRILFLLNNNIDPYNWFPNSNREEFPHIRFFTYESLLELLIKNNFHFVKNYSYHFPSLPYFPNRLKKVIPFGKRIDKYFSEKKPTSFAKGITILVKKR